ncbi:MAG: right-handed parallel beta-helix repeat-containing protein [Bacteroidales bacterium]|nr:right-handed parallel beta-helix repeat-containing protein [Bacteroidales bacterium]
MTRKLLILLSLLPGCIAILVAASLHREQPDDSPRCMYVAPDGDDSAAGTADAPWRSIQKAFDAAGPGSTIILRGGVYAVDYTLTLSRSGERGNPITVKAETPDNPPVLDGGNGLGVLENENAIGDLRIMKNFLANYQKFPPFNPDEGIIRVSGSHVVVDGLKLTGSRSCGLYFMSGASHLVVQNCHVEHCQGPGICFGAENSASRDVKVLRNYVLDCSQRAREAISLRTVDSFEVAYNKVERVIKESIDAKGGCSNGTIHHNYVLDGGHCSIYMDGGYPDRPLERNIEVYCNVIENPYGTGICVAAEAGNNVEDIRIYNNVIWTYRAENLGSGIKVAKNSMNIDGYIKDVLIFNNTVYGFRQQGIYVNYPNIENIRICNNISAKTLDQLAVHKNTDPKHVITDRNLLWGPTSFQGRGAILADPLFTDAEHAGFTLQEASPAVNSAYKKFSPAEDINGVLRPQGRAADLGAYEFKRGSK